MISVYHLGEPASRHGSLNSLFQVALHARLSPGRHMVVH